MAIKKENKPNTGAVSDVKRTVSGISVEITDTTRTKARATLSPDAEQKVPRTSFVGHDFSDQLPFFLTASKDWPTVADFISDRLIRLLGNSYFSFTYAGVHTDIEDFAGLSFEDYRELRDRLSYQDLYTGNITIDGDIAKTYEFMQMMDVLYHADCNLRIPPYSEYVAGQLYHSVSVPLYGPAAVYNVPSFNSYPLGYLRKLQALGEIDSEDIAMDAYIGCRKHEYVKSKGD